MSDDVTIQIKTELLRTVFDVAISSLDFGSGFLDHEEVEALRAIAVLLGVDPIVATPEQMRPWTRAAEIIGE